MGNRCAKKNQKQRPIDVLQKNYSESFGKLTGKHPWWGSILG